MGKNKVENFIFSLMICFLMVFGVTIYNTYLHTESAVSLIQVLVSFKFVAIFLVALTIDWFIVAPFVKGIVKRFTNENTPFIKRILMISGLMVVFMCAVMSMIATLVQGYEGTLLNAYGHAFILNFVFALPLQIILAGPIARTIFLRFFPMPVQQEQVTA